MKKQSMNGITISVSTWFIHLKLMLSNDVEKNPGPKSPNKKPDPLRKSKIKRSKSSVRDSGLSSASSASPSIPDDALSRKLEDVNTDNEAIRTPDIFNEEVVSKLDDGNTKHLESEIKTLQSQLLSVDQNVEKLLNSIETLRPLYNQAKEALNSLSNQHQKNNLVFHGIKPDKLEVLKNNDNEMLNEGHCTAITKFA